VVLHEAGFQVQPPGGEGVGVLDIARAIGIAAARKVEGRSSKGEVTAALSRRSNCEVRRPK
jgi:hypothetical protein